MEIKEINSRADESAPKSALKMKVPHKHENTDPSHSLARRASRFPPGNFSQFLIFRRS
jgi:hypothetical protein